MKIKKDTK